MSGNTPHHHLSRLQALCLVLLGAVLALWLDGQERRQRRGRQKSSEGTVVRSGTLNEIAIAPPCAERDAVVYDDIWARNPATPAAEAAATTTTTASSWEESESESAGIDYFGRNTNSWNPVQQNTTVVPLASLQESNNNSRDGNKTVAISSALNYLRHTRQFLQTFQACVQDSYCHIMYQFGLETGGEALTRVLFPLLNHVAKHLDTNENADPADVDLRDSCCHQRLLQRFLERPDAYCALKFSAWQMSDDELAHVVRTCQLRDPRHRNFTWPQQQQEERQSPQRPRRTLVLSTFRDPTQIFMRLIEHMCDADFLPKRTVRVQRACTSCAKRGSKDDKAAAAVWRSFATVVERQVAATYRISQWMDRSPFTGALTANRSANNNGINSSSTAAFAATTSSQLDLKVLTLEANDVDDFLSQWQPDISFPVILPLRQSRRPGESEEDKRGDKQGCSFHLTTEWLKLLRPSLGIYRWLLAGL